MRGAKRGGDNHGRVMIYERGWPRGGGRGEDVGGGRARQAPPLPSSAPVLLSMTLCTCR